MEKLNGLRIPPFMFREGMIVFTSENALAGKPEGETNLSRLKKPVFCQLLTFDEYHEPHRDLLIDTAASPILLPKLWIVTETPFGRKIQSLSEWKYGDTVEDPTKVYATVEYGAGAIQRVPIFSLRWLQEVGRKWSSQLQKTVFDWPEIPARFQKEMLRREPYSVADRVLLHSGKFKRLTGHAQKSCIGFIAKQEEKGVFWVTSTVMKPPDPYREPVLLRVTLDEIRPAIGPAPEPWGEDE